MLPPKFDFFPLIQRKLIQRLFGPVRLGGGSFARQMFRQGIAALPVIPPLDSGVQPAKRDEILGPAVAGLPQLMRDAPVFNLSLYMSFAASFEGGGFLYRQEWFQMTSPAFLTCHHQTAWVGSR